MILELNSIFQLGLIYGLVGVAVYLSFRLIDLPDLTIEVSFPTGACIFAELISKGFPFASALCSSLIAGFLIGLFTACLHIYLRIISLLASIITIGIMYSINLRMMGKPNLSLIMPNNIIAQHPNVFLLMIVVLALVAVLYFLHSEIGLAMRVVGKNAPLGYVYGVSRSKAIIVLLGTSNALVGLAGALFVMTQDFADVSLGHGTIVNGLAAVLIGEVLLIRFGINYHLIGCIIGALLYYVVLALALNSHLLGFRPCDVSLVTGVILITLAYFSKTLNVRGSETC